jgi:hypothetical protein
VCKSDPWAVRKLRKGGIGECNASLQGWGPLRVSNVQGAALNGQPAPEFAECHESWQFFSPISIIRQ